jgi:C1A family cysteine protease
MFKLLAGAGVTHLETKFMEHVATHALSYGTQEEYTFRMALFAKRDVDYK